jgi:hypothetical protein
MMKSEINFKGVYLISCRDSLGRVKWREMLRNGITTAGLTNILGTYFGALTQNADWYFGLIDNAGYSAIAAADTMSSHAGWTENIKYDSETRPAWTMGAAANAAIATSTVTTFATSVNSTIRGIFLASNATKGGTTGILWSTALFNTARSFSASDTWEVTSYTVKAAG